MEDSKDILQPIPEDVEVELYSIFNTKEIVQPNLKGYHYGKNLFYFTVI